MYLKFVLLGLLWTGWSSIALIILTVNVIFTVFGKRIFARVCNKFGDDYNVISDSLKVELFKDMNEMSTSKAEESLNILEIGGGSGTNFKYWKRKAKVQIVEPNPHFVPFFEERRKGYPQLVIKDMVQGVGEDLASAGVGDCSVDCVVMTLVLCSVTDSSLCLQEIIRVLKPGGKFFYMEHIVAEAGTTTSFVQKTLMFGGFWPFMADGCCLDRATDKLVEAAGFSSVEQTRYMLSLPEDKFSLRLMGFPVRPHLRGVATK